MFRLLLGFRLESWVMRFQESMQFEVCSLRTRIASCICSFIPIFGVMLVNLIINERIVYVK